MLKEAKDSGLGLGGRLIQWLKLKFDSCYHIRGSCPSRNSTKAKHGHVYDFD